MIKYKISIRLILTIFFGASILFTAGSYSQSLHYPLVASYAGMGAYSQNFLDPLSTSSNQASLANVNVMGAAIYGERRFLLQELNLYSIALCLPISYGGIGLSAQYFGYNEYNETQIGVGFGKSLGKVDIGVQINFQALRIPGYGNDFLFNFEVGSILHISEQLYAGLHVFNPTGCKFGNDRLEELASVYSVGLGYEVSEKLFLSAESIKDEDKPMNIHAGLQYVFAKKFFTRVGLYTEATRLYFGVGMKWNGYRVDITGSYHSQLGLTPGLLLVFEGKHKKE